MWANKRALELHQNLRKLLEQLAGDEHRREKLALSGGGHGGGRGGQGKAGGERRSGAHDVVRGGALCSIVLLVPCSNRFFSKKLNRTRPSDEYQSCRSSYQQQFLQKPYRVFLPRSKVI
jgi:hypothetical protein